MKTRENTENAEGFSSVTLWPPPTRDKTRYKAKGEHPVGETQQASETTRGNESNLLALHCTEKLLLITNLHINYYVC